MKFLLRYGELGLKGRHVRGQMMRHLRRHLVRLFEEHDGEAAVWQEEGRLFVESETADVEALLGRVFGVVSFSRVWDSTAELKALSALALRLAKEVRNRGPSFAVRTRRVGTHPFTSTEVAREIGAAILAGMPDLEVDLTTPDWEVYAEIRGEKGYLYTDVMPGVGGLPLGTQGKVVTLVETPEGMMASWLMMKRGCYLLPVFRGRDSWARALRVWDPDIRWRPIEALEEMQGVAEDTGALGFVYPWTAPEASKDDLRPAFYPLMGLSSERLRNLHATVVAER